MRAAVITAFNQPWEFQTLADPKPAPGQVLIRVEASGLCGTDLHVHHGTFGLEPPVVAGHEPVGKIVELGAGVLDLRVGDRVGVCWVQKGCGRCWHCRQGRPNYCSEQQTWMQLGGGNSELMLAWAEGCTLVPEGLEPEEAAPIFCAGYTVFSGLRNADPRPGDRVAVLGIGGLGHLALQFSKALGLETVAITSSQDKMRAAAEMGADSVVVAGDHVGKSLQMAGGADIVLSTTNSGLQISQVMLGIRPEGRLVNMGVNTDGPIQFNAMDFMIEQKKLIGSSQNHRRDLVEALDLVAARKVTPILETYALDEANTALERLAQNKVRYRAVLRHR